MAADGEAPCAHVQEAQEAREAEGEAQAMDEENQQPEQAEAQGMEDQVEIPTAENAQEGQETAGAETRNVVQATLNEWLVTPEAAPAHDGRRLKRRTSAEGEAARGAATAARPIDAQGCTWFNRALMDTFNTFGQHVQIHINEVSDRVNSAATEAREAKTIAEESRAKANTAEAKAQRVVEAQEEIKRSRSASTRP